MAYFYTGIIFQQSPMPHQRQEEFGPHRASQAACYFYSRRGSTITHYYTLLLHDGHYAHEWKFQQWLHSTSTPQSIFAANIFATPLYRADPPSNRCFCGHDKHDYDKHGSGICDMQCSGDTSLTCGGRGAMNVFRVSGCRHCRAYLVNS